MGFNSGFKGLTADTARKLCWWH